MKKYLNNKGGSYIWLMILIIIFIGLTVLLLDNASISMNTKKIKSGLNLSVKAAALAIKEDEQLAKGIFTINSSWAEETFKQILAENIGLNQVTLEPLSTGSLVTEKPKIKEFIVENSVPATYYSPALKNTFAFEHPSILAVIRVKVKGVFSSRIIILYKLSSSQLTSAYD